jgi:hypothetical protein
MSTAVAEGPEGIGKIGRRLYIEPRKAVTTSFTVLSVAGGAAVWLSGAEGKLGVFGGILSGAGAAGKRPFPRFLRREDEWSMRAWSLTLGSCAQRADADTVPNRITGGPEVAARRITTGSDGLKDQYPLTRI